MSKFVVRYGAMRNLGLFVAQDKEDFARGTEIIARTDRGLEAGEILCEATEETIEHLHEPRQGQILRRMTHDDAHEIARIQDQREDKFQTCVRCIKKLGLPMHLVDVEHIFGGERIVVYYLADGRVDFRELVKMLASEFQTRIEMRQIGVRDEAKLMADYGDCGKPVCCNTHLVQMPPVSMKMAKLQKATLDPTKISGRCGRLKCCLRYEYEIYEKVQKEMPPIGSLVETPEGRAKVIGQEILAGQLLTENRERVRKLYDLHEVSPVNSPSNKDTETQSEET